ncbi:hypothetical protein EZS27_025036 [termite gut metagenome]|uniref:Uncharacterized protein n=1 Tax=termite gut metagenome TaxID=433724 RepID=A0A5J4QXZ1_9ZZZZ
MKTEELLGVLHSQKEIRGFKDWNLSLENTMQYITSIL